MNQWRTWRMRNFNNSSLIEAVHAWHALLPLEPGEKQVKWPTTDQSICTVRVINIYFINALLSIYCKFYSDGYYHLYYYLSQLKQTTYMQETHCGATSPIFHVHIIPIITPQPRPPV